MRFLRLWVFVVNFGTIDVVSSCELIADENNVYPWLIEIFWHTVRGHGCLISPDRVVSAYKPFSDLVKNKSLIDKFILSGYHFGRKGVLVCRDARIASQIDEYTEEGEFHNILLWKVAGAFNISFGRLPLLFDDLNYLDKTVLTEYVDATKIGDTCVLPVFQSAGLGLGFRIVTNKVTLTDFDDCKTNFCKGCVEFNKKALTCATSKRYYKDERLREMHFEGSVLVCQHHPIGLSIAVKSFQGRDGSTPQTLAVIVKLAHVATTLRKYAEEDWPKDLTTTTTTTSITSAGTAITTTTKTSTTDDNSGRSTEPSTSPLEVTSDKVTSTYRTTTARATVTDGKFIDTRRKAVPRPNSARRYTFAAISSMFVSILFLT